METTLRTFIAVTIPMPSALRDVVSRLKALGRPVKAVNAETTHITLKFLGDVFESRVSEVTAIVQDVAMLRSAFDLDLAGLGAFPRIQRPSVVWAGVDDDESLCAIAADLEDRLAKIGYTREKRPFRPHLTLARLRDKPPRGLQAIFDAEAGTHWGTITIKSIELLRSELTPQGPVYTVLESAGFKSA